MSSEVAECSHGGSSDVSEGRRSTESVFSVSEVSVGF